jgi:hypothetical protein
MSFEFYLHPVKFESSLEALLALECGVLGGFLSFIQDFVITSLSELLMARSERAGRAQSPLG